MLRAASRHRKIPGAGASFFGLANPDWREFRRALGGIPDSYSFAGSGGSILPEYSRIPGFAIIELLCFDALKGDLQWPGIQATMNHAE